MVVDGHVSGFAACIRNTSSFEPIFVATSNRNRWPWLARVFTYLEPSYT